MRARQPFKARQKVCESTEEARAGRPPKRRPYIGHSIDGVSILTGFNNLVAMTLYCEDGAVRHGLRRPYLNGAQCWAGRVRLFFIVMAGLSISYIESSDFLFVAYMSAIYHIYENFLHHISPFEKIEIPIKLSFVVGISE